jgi:hypothetical protein
MTGLMEEKKALIWQFTDERTESSREMTLREANELIRFLEKYDPLEKMKKKVFAIAHSIGWIIAGDETDKKINQAAIDKFIKKHGTVKKALNEQNKAELAKTVSQFEMIAKHTQESKAGKAVEELLSELGLNTEKKLKQRVKKQISLS